MKTVFTKDMVCHHWAQQLQPYGRTSNESIHFDGRDLYSYSTIIASILPVLINGQKTVILSSQNYSITTSSHQSYAHQAVSHFNRISLHTVYGDYDQRNPWKLTQWFHQELTEAIKRKDEAIKKYKRARGQRSKDKHQGVIIGYPNTVKTLEAVYNALLKRCITDFNYVADAPEQSEINGLRERFTKEQNQDTSNVDDLYKQMVADEKERKARDKQRQEEQEIEDARRFHNFESSYTGRCINTYLRVMGGVQNIAPREPYIETSKGVHITASEFTLAYKLWKKGKLLGHKVNNWDITTVDTKKQIIIAGCHTVTFSEMDDTMAILETELNLWTEAQQQACR